MPLTALESYIGTLRDKGYYPFVAMFSWSYQDDLIAVDRLKQYLGTSYPDTGIDSETAQAYYLTGARTYLLIGYTNSPIGLQRLCSSVIFNTPIQANIYHAVEAHQLLSVLPAAQANP